MKDQILKTKFRRLKYKFKHDFFTVNNLVVAVAAFIALSWAWGSINAMQKNYTLQQELDSKKRDKLVAEIQTKTLEYEQKYLKSSEYQELAARDKLGLVMPGEQVLILPKDEQSASRQPEETTIEEEKIDSNFRQWVNFLFGGNANRE